MVAAVARTIPNWIGIGSLKSLIAATTSDTLSTTIGASGPRLTPPPWAMIVTMARAGSALSGKRVFDQARRRGVGPRVTGCEPDDEADQHTSRAEHEEDVERGVLVDPDGIREYRPESVLQAIAEPFECDQREGADNADHDRRDREQQQAPDRRRTRLSDHRLRPAHGAILSTCKSRVFARIG